MNEKNTISIEEGTEGPLPTLFVKVLGSRSWPASILGIGLLQALLTRLNLPAWTCLFYKATGFSCPGCGMSRSMASLLNADLSASWSYHPFGGFYIIGALILFTLACLPTQPRHALLKGLRAIDTRIGMTILIIAIQIIWGLWRLVMEISTSV